MHINQVTCKIKYTQTCYKLVSCSYTTSEREHAKVRHDDIYILTTEK